MRLKIILFVFFSLFTQMSFSQDLKNSLFTDILKTYVADGNVNYTSLKKDSRLNQYIKHLSNIDPQKLISKNERLAFWINVYNAYTLKLICDNYPLKSIRDLNPKFSFKTVWDKDFIIINKKKMSLNDIEHKIIRPQFKEPRIHFALVCAAKGCPILRSQAYRGEKLNAQLDEQVRIFLVDKEKNSFDLKNKRAYISPIFKWYFKDFGQTKEDLLKFITQFLPPHTSRAICSSLRQWRISYTFYDWSLNSR